MQEIINLLEKDDRIINLKKKKMELLNDVEFMGKINKFKELDMYSEEYKKIKLELFENSTFMEFKQLENEINLLILEINSKLKELTDERGCI